MSEVEQKPVLSTVPTPDEARAIRNEKDAYADSVWNTSGKNAVGTYVDAELTREIRAGHTSFTLSILALQRHLLQITGTEFDMHLLNKAVIDAVHARKYYAGGKRWSHVQVNTLHYVDEDECCALV